MKRLLITLAMLPLVISPQASHSKEPTTFASLPWSFGSQNYYPPLYHQMNALAAAGESIELEDGAVWSTNEYALSDIFYWKPNDPLFLTQNQEWFSSYKYRLINQATGGSVPVNLSLTPILTNPNAKFTAYIDLYKGEVILTDGSHWKICPRDYYRFSEWILNDCIIIGINSGWESSYNSILINTNLDKKAVSHFVRARQI